MRDNLGKVTVNNWKSGGKFEFRGIRTSDSTDFSATSQHAYGKAVDFDVEGMTAAEVNEWLIANRNAKELRGISFIECRINTNIHDA